MRLIDADKMKEDLLTVDPQYETMIHWCITVLDAQPTIEPQRIKGRWLRKESDLSWWYECSECGESPLFDPYEHEVRTPFCPWCGAEMKGEEE